MTTLWLSELMSSASPSTLSSGFHFHSVQTRQVMFKTFIARGDIQNVTRGMVCCINVQRSGRSPVTHFYARCSPLIVGSGARIAGEGEHSRDGLAQGSGCLSAGLEVVQYLNNSCRCPGVYMGAGSDVLISSPILGNLPTSFSNFPSSFLISRKQLASVVEVTALLSRDSESAWNQAPPVVLGLLRLAPGL